MCRGRMKIFLAGRKRRSFVRALVHERGLRQIAGQRQILVLNVSQDVNLGWLAAIQRSTKSKKSFAWVHDEKVMSHAALRSVLRSQKS
jgi:hypothetical protein